MNKVSGRIAVGDRAGRATPQAASRLDHPATIPCAPPAYQAEVLRGQVCDDINRRFWLERKRLADAFEDRKDQVQRDHEKLSADAFLTKYNGWKFL